jgi:hypothetical protein
VLAVVAAGVVAFVLLSDDSSDSTTVTEAVAPSDSPVTSSGAPATERGDERKAGQDSKPTTSKGNGDSDADRSRAKGSSSAGRDQNDERCPEALGEELCRYMAEAAAVADGTRTVRRGECPPEWGRDYCKSLKDAAKDAERNTTTVKPGECPPEFGREYCKSLYEASKDAGG